MTCTFSSSRGASVCERLVKRGAPADADRHVVGQRVGDIHAGRDADRLGDVGGLRRLGHHDRFAEAEGLLQLRLKLEAFGDLAVDPDLDLALLDRLVDVAHHGDAANAETVGDLVLGQAFDIIHPGDAHAVARDAPGATLRCWRAWLLRGCGSFRAFWLLPCETAVLPLRISNTVSCKDTPQIEARRR